MEVEHDAVIGELLGHRPREVAPDDRCLREHANEHVTAQVVESDPTRDGRGHEADRSELRAA